MIGGLGWDFKELGGFCFGVRVVLIGDFFWASERWCEEGGSRGQTRKTKGGDGPGSNPVEACGAYAVFCTKIPKSSRCSTPIELIYVHNS